MFSHLWGYEAKISLKKVQSLHMRSEITKSDIWNIKNECSEQNTKTGTKQTWKQLGKLRIKEKRKQN